MPSTASSVRRARTVSTGLRLVLAARSRTFHFRSRSRLFRIRRRAWARLSRHDTIIRDGDNTSSDHRHDMHTGVLELHHSGRLRRNRNREAGSRPAEMAQRLAVARASWNGMPNEDLASRDLGRALC